MSCCAPVEATMEGPPSLASMGLSSATDSTTNSLNVWECRQTCTCSRVSPPVAVPASPKAAGQGRDIHI